MIITILVIVGLAFGSFVNALVWRIHKQGDKKKTHAKIKGKDVNLSAVHGRSVCIHCGHELAPKDLIPVFSWLSLKGKCRYCKGAIQDTPLAEIVTSALFVISYLAWPFELESVYSWGAFVLWLAMSVALVALVIYDFKYMLLPNRIVFPMYGVAAAMRILLYLDSEWTFAEFVTDIGLGVLVGGGIFYLIYQVSQGKWIGGGDVKLGFLIGLSVGFENALIALLAAFYIAAIIVFPLIIIKKLNRKSRIPFGPFLILGMVLAMLWGDSIRILYTDLFGI